MPPTSAPPTILCLSSYFKGNRFLQACKEAGWRVILVVREAVLSEPWARESCDEVFALPSLFDRAAVIKSIAYLARSRQIDRIAPLDDFDVEMASTLREHMRIPGMGESTSRYFRDKLAMRERCRDRGIAVPEFIHVLNADRVAAFLRDVPPPWLIKPRSSANSWGIAKFHEAGDLQRRVEELGDDRSNWLIERYLPGDVYHVDGVICGGRILLEEPHKYRRPLMDVAKGGGIFATRTLDRGSDEARELVAMHREVVRHFGFVNGVTHMEFIRARENGRLHFLETAARVGGAHIYDLVEAATGVSLWTEWARLEMFQGDGNYSMPAARQDYGGLIVALARQESPDTSCFSDPEVVVRLGKKHHVGLVLRSDSPRRIEELLDSYEPRIASDFLTTLPESAPAQ